MKAEHPVTLDVDPKVLVKGKLRGAFVAMNARRVIGVNGGLPWRYSADIKRFKQRTMGYTIVMGRLTWESIGGKSLPDRRNIVISRSHIDGVECFSNLDKAFQALANDDVWIIGGGQIYLAVFDHLNLLDVTMVPDQINSPDTVKFPKIDPQSWRLASSNPLDENPALVNHIYLRRSAADYRGC